MMITAKEARATASDITQGKNQEMLQTIAEKIESSCSLGYMTCTLGFSINLTVREHLEELGYHIQIGHHYNESFTSISW